MSMETRRRVVVLFKCAGFHVKENQGTFIRRHQGVQDSAGTESLFQF